MTLDLNKMRAQLEAKRAELQDNAAGLTQAHPQPVDAIEANEGYKDHGDRSISLEEQEKEQSLLYNTQSLLTEVQDALERIKNGTYGKCLVCGQPIPEKRLEALPWAALCVKDEEQLEQRNLSREDFLLTQSNMSNENMYETPVSNDDILL